MLGFRRRTAQAVLMVGVVALLAGCGVAAPAATSTPTPSRTSRPSASPTPTPTATAAALVLSTAGLGPIRMGSPIPTGAPVRWDPDACPDGPAGGSAGFWLATDPVAGELTVDRQQPFGVSTRNGDRDGPVDLLQVWSSQYRTPSGLHVGSPDAAVRTALPKATVLEDDVSRAYSVVSGGWRITLTVADSDGSVLSDDATVQIISVYPATDPATSWWNTDVGAYCSV